MAESTTKKAAKKAAVKKPVAAPAAVKKPAAAPAAVKKPAAAPAAVKPSVAKKAAAKKVVTVAAPAAPVKKVAARKVAAPKKATAAKMAATHVTKVIAKLDAGFGNELFIRGSTAGLAWDKGVLMTNVAADEWVWESAGVAGELEFKILLNDSSWSVGPNGVVFAGATLSVEPQF